MAGSVIIKGAAHERELEILLHQESDSQAARAGMITVAQGIERAVVVLPSWSANDPAYSKRVLSSGPRADSQTSPGESLEIARQLLETLAAMHARGIAHVDILRHVAIGDCTVVKMPSKPRRRTVPEAEFPLAYHAVPEIGWADWMLRCDPRGALQRPGVVHDPYAADVWMVGTALWRSQAPAGDDLLAPLLARMTHAKPCARPSAEEALAAVVAIQSIASRGEREAPRPRRTSANRI